MSNTRRQNSRKGIFSLFIEKHIKSTKNALSKRSVKRTKKCTISRHFQCPQNNAIVRMPKGTNY